MRWLRHGGRYAPTPSVHRLRPGLPGYLILFAPPALAPQRQWAPRRPPSPPVFLPISAHSTATPGVPPPPAPLEPGSIGGSPGLGPGIPPPTGRAAYARFTPNESGQRSPPTCYRGCWHVVSRGFFRGYGHLFLPAESGLRPEGLRPARGVAASGFPPLRNIPHCCLP